MEKSTIINILLGTVSFAVIAKLTLNWLVNKISTAVDMKMQLHFDKKLEDYKKNIEAALHVEKSQYDKEVEIYEKIWISLCRCTESIHKLDAMLNINNALKNVGEHIKSEIELSQKAHADFSSTLEYYSLFYNDIYYDNLKKIGTLFTTANASFVGYAYNNAAYKDAKSLYNLKLMDECISELKQSIKVHLDNYIHGLK